MSNEQWEKHPPLPTDVAALLRQLARYFGRMHDTPPQFIASYLNLAAQRYEDEGSTAIVGGKGESLEASP